LSGPETLVDGLNGGRVLVLAVHVALQSAVPIESSRVDPAVLLQVIACPRSQPVERPAGLATPTTGTLSSPPFTSAWSAGKIML
jgi:hypothetical protein